MYLKEKRYRIVATQALVLFAIVTLSLFAKADEFKERTLFDRVLYKGIVSINIPDSIPSFDYVPSSSPSDLPIDRLIRKLAVKNKAPIYSSEKVELDQYERNIARQQSIFLKKYRVIFSRWDRSGLSKLDAYMAMHKESLSALNDLQIFAGIVKCLRNDKSTPEQCASRWVKDAATRFMVGKAVVYLGLGGLTTMGALAQADVKAVFDVARLYNEVTGSIEDREVIEQQERDRAALGVDIDSMKSYLDLQLARYEQDQNIISDLLVRSWKNSEESLNKLKRAQKELTSAWKQLEHHKYSDRLRKGCEKESSLDEQCTSLMHSYDLKTKQPKPKDRAGIPLAASTFRGILRNDFTQACSALFKNIKKEIDRSGIGAKIDTLYYLYQDLNASMRDAEYAFEEYKINKERYLQRNINLSIHYRQQLDEKYGVHSSEYNEGTSALRAFKKKMTNFQPKAFRSLQYYDYVGKRLKIVKADFEFEKVIINKSFKEIEHYIEEISDTRKGLDATLRGKSEKLAAALKACLYDFDRRSHGCREEYDSKIVSIRKNIDKVKHISDIAMAKCTAAAALGERIEEQVEREKGMLSGLAVKVTSFEKKISAAQKVAEEIRGDDQKIAKWAKEIESRLTDLGALSLKICQKTKGLNDDTVSSDVHQKNARWIQENKKEFKVYLKQIKEIYREIKASQKKIAAAKDRYTSVKSKDMENMEQMLDNINHLSSEFDTAVKKADRTISDNLAALSLVLSRKQAVRRSIKALGKLCEKEHKKEIDALRGRLPGIELPICPERISVEVDGSKSTFVKLDEEREKLIEKIRQVKSRFKRTEESLKKIESLEEDRKMILLLVDSYLLRSEKFATDGSLCVVLSEEMMKRVFIPQVTGMKLDRSLDLLRRAGLNNITLQSMGEAASRALENKVMRQSPDTHKRVKKETKITLTHYGHFTTQAERAAAEQTISDQNDCSKWPGSVPGYQGGQYGCICPDGTVQNRANNACITREEAREEQKNAALAEADCPARYPGSVNYWNDASRRVGCRCPGPTKVWNRARNACITREQAALETMDCSRWPGSIPGYQNGNPSCVCPGGMVHNSANTACVTERQARQEKTDCSRWPGTVPGYSNGQFGCVCADGLVPNSANNACVKKRKVQPAISNYSDCPKQNPTNLRPFIVDTNNNPNDRTYIECMYFKDRALEYQKPYLNGKLHGKFLAYSWSKPHTLSESIQYRYGQKNGMCIRRVRSEGKDYLQRKCIYKNGSLVHATNYGKDGSIRSDWEYRNGRPYRGYRIDSAGHKWTKNM